MSSPAKVFEPEVAEPAGEKDPANMYPWLPCRLTLDVPVTGFTIGDLMKMTAGTVIATNCQQTNDVPLRVNGQLIAWTEFEVVGSQLAVRITELA